MVAEDCSEYDSHPGNILVHKLCYSTLIENFTKFDRNEILPYQTTTSKPESNLFIIRSISGGTRNLFLGGSYINFCVCVKCKIVIYNIS